MRIKITASIIVLLLPLIGLLILSSEGSRDKISPSKQDDLLRKLSIETFDKKVLAADFILKDLNGKTVRLRDFRGKVVFLNFWAT